MIKPRRSENPPRSNYGATRCLSPGYYVVGAHSILFPSPRFPRLPRTTNVEQSGVTLSNLDRLVTLAGALMSYFKVEVSSSTTRISFNLDARIWSLLPLLQLIS